MMKYHVDDADDKDQMFDDLEMLGQILYTTAVNYKVLRALIKNVNHYAKTIQLPEGEDLKFKTDPSVKNLKQLFIKLAVNAPPTPKADRAASRKLLSELESADEAESDIDTGPGPSTRELTRETVKRNLIHELESEEEQQTAPKKAKKKKSKKNKKD